MLGPCNTILNWSSVTDEILASTMLHALLKAYWVELILHHLFAQSDATLLHHNLDTEKIKISK